ncbi:tyrosine-type recombinase/integrase [Alicyclobacillus fastidiosus]|uniref:Tyrosine-type recombinase/integrase n=1 Tax=Alicyclobacillus fastidiosus TaxID=392011 RepID=A0ABV5AJ57_9BACL|nr:tyrosine-type recombinase/integrase [Alicyclobacillus fastidiosus]WEH09173.1 tyrosine-type recombinase/integrase [Alicyclobacillus fastidiosus]
MLLKYAVKDFLDDREYKNVSPFTLSGYRRTLNEFHRFCVDQEIVGVTDVTPAIMKQYFIFCQKERGNNPVTLNHKLINLRAFFHYLQKEVELFTENNNPIRKISKFKTDVRIEVFTDEHIKLMLGYFRRLKYRDKSFYSYRDATIIVTLLGTGARLGELINIRWADVDFKNSTISLFGKKRMAIAIPTAAKLERELAEYKVYIQQRFSDLPEYVFVDSRGRKLTDNAIKNMFKRLKEVMNFRDVRLSSHTFRHTFAHRCLMNGMDVFTLQRLLRHSDMTMTQRYLALWGSALKEQNDKYNPLNSVNL